MNNSSQQSQIRPYSFPVNVIENTTNLKEIKNLDSVKFKLKEINDLNNNYYSTQHHNNNNKSNSKDFDNNVDNGFCNIPTFSKVFRMPMNDESHLKSVLFSNLYEALYNKPLKSKKLQKELEKVKKIKNCLIFQVLVKHVDKVNQHLQVEIIKLIEIFTIKNNRKLEIPHQLLNGSMLTIGVSTCSIQALTPIEYYIPGYTLKVILHSIDMIQHLCLFTLDYSTINSINNDLSQYLYRNLGTFNQSESDIESMEFTNLFDVLSRQRQFINPWSVNLMANNLGLNQLDSFIPYKKLPYSEFNYKKLRDYQNYEWAQESVIEGIRKAKNGKFEEAIKIYIDALDVDPRNRDAYVALGAAYANTNRLELAIDNFKYALKIDPKDPNANKYLESCLSRLQDQKSKISTPSSNNTTSVLKTDKLKDLLKKEYKKDKHLKKKKKQKDKDKKKKKKKSKSVSMDNDSDSSSLSSSSDTSSSDNEYEQKSTEKKRKRENK
ncbi:hypothetical protein DLAC_01225 [Tieghemostelium lacteum]|uniref:Uncharacterized protein n=1 Tax=Tieghemostelium lacteum TaxID=361077 RepID=A0A152A840_TIELA|nr:hypothetical protein DLAC_01225 [Tieghemostelium lacteum]|eukprot:KYR02386.1 hypothetical protein DLAC_01225 [Tieghemostelium lacteum]